MIMGMPVIIDIPESIDETVFEEVSSYLHGIDETFSTYRHDSEVSRFNNGSLKKDNLSADVRYVSEQCEYYSGLTDGYFSAYYSEIFDPSGFVKAWAMHHVAVIIQSGGYATYLINIAGDMIASGETRTWNIAIQDPLQKDSIYGVVALHNQSIATSGSYERGDHIINPITRSTDTDLISVSIYGNDIINADVCATTCIAMGSAMAQDFLSRYPTYAALLIKKNGSSILVNGFTVFKTQIAQ
jgi:thiamine biosynthesis lipoprotein